MMEEEDSSPTISFENVLTDDGTTTENVEKERQILESVLLKGKEKMRSDATESRAGFLMQMLRSRMESQSCVKNSSEVSPYLSSSIVESDDGNNDYSLNEQEENSDDCIPDASLTATTDKNLNNDESVNIEDKSSDCDPSGSLTVIAPVEKDGNDDSMNGLEEKSTDYIPEEGLTIIAATKIKREVLSDEEDCDVGKIGDPKSDLDKEERLSDSGARDEGETLSQPLQCANCFQQFYSIHEAQIHSISCSLPYSVGMHDDIHGNIGKGHEGGVVSASQSLVSLNENYIRDNLEKSLRAAAKQEHVFHVSSSTGPAEIKDFPQGKSAKMDISKADSSKKLTKERTRRRKGKVYQHAGLARAKDYGNVLGSAEEEEEKFSCLLCNFSTTNLFDLGKHVNDIHGSRVASPQKVKSTKTGNNHEEWPMKKLYKVCVVCGMDTQDFVLFHGNESTHSLSSRLGRLLKQKICVNDVGSRYLCHRCVKRVETYEEAMVIQFQMKTQFENTKSLLEGKLSRDVGNDSEVEYIEVPVDKNELSKVQIVSEDSLDEAEIEKEEDQQYVPSAESDGSWTPTGRRRRKKKKVPTATLR